MTGVQTCALPICFPVTINGRSSTYFPEPYRYPQRVNASGITLQSNPGDLDILDDSPSSWSLPNQITNLQSSRSKSNFDKAKTQNTTPKYLSEAARYKTDLGLYERKEVGAELTDQYGMKSAMSLDGLLSPISFYPTFKNSTFAYTKYFTKNCPFCNGKKTRTIKIQKYADGQNPINIDHKIYCDKCCYGNEALDVVLKGTTSTSSSSTSSEILPPYIVTSGSDFQTLIDFRKSSSSSINSVTSTTSSNNDIPINLITLNPIIISFGELKNTQAQYYTGAYSGIHDNLNGTYIDRAQHCIEVVARGTVPPDEYKYKLETSKNMLSRNKFSPYTEKDPDYYGYDTIGAFFRHRLSGGTGPIDDKSVSENNQRFFGLRGPLVIHGWGFDTEGYPVPNAADEPYAKDEYGRRKRFKLKLTVDAKPTDYTKLEAGAAYIQNTQYAAGVKIYGSKYNTNKYTNGSIMNDTSGGILEYIGDSNGVWYKITIEDDLSNIGGFDPGADDNLLDGYKGSVISKTQKWDGKKWSIKKKMKEFYLNWGERPDLWPVGPVDLRWDAERKVWTYVVSKA